MSRVLVIDDEPMIRWSVEQTLRAAGHEVCLAGTGTEGIDHLRRCSPQVVLLDVRLPDCDGLGLLREIKKQDAQKAAVVVMTAFSEAYSAEEAIRLGACGFLEKPFRFDVLDEVVRSALTSVESGTC